MKQSVIILFMIFYAAKNIEAQLAPGIGIFYRMADDIPGNAPGIKLALDIYESDASNVIPAYFTCGLSYSTFQPRRGTATMDAYDSLQQPQQITVPITQQPHDFIASIGVGFKMNPKHRKSYPYFTAGISGILRTIEVVYLESFDSNLYNEGFRTRNPNIPGAVSFGFRIGGGYQINFKKLIVQPNFSFGFGSSDARNKHPWNKYPNHIDFGLNVLFNTGLN